MSDHYQEQREAEHFVNKTSTPEPPEPDKDSWQTPIELFRVALENHKAEQSQGLKHITDGIQNYRNRKGIENNGSNN